MMKLIVYLASRYCHCLSPCERPDHRKILELLAKLDLIYHIIEIFFHLVKLKN
jgi:hypothetical protein